MRNTRLHKRERVLLLRCDEFQSLHLGKVGGVAKHMHEQQFGYISVAVLRSSTLVLYLRSAQSTLLGDHRPFLCCSFASTDVTNEITQFDGLGSVDLGHLALDHVHPALECTKGRLPNFIAFWCLDHLLRAENLVAPAELEGKTAMRANF